MIFILTTYMQLLSVLCFPDYYFSWIITVAVVEVEPVTNGNWFNKSCLCNEASKITKKNKISIASRLVNMYWCWRLGNMPGGSMKLCAPSSIPSPMNRFHMAVPESYLLILFYFFKITQLCPPLRDPMDCSLPGSSVHRIFQVRVLEWVAISFSNTHL